MYFMVQTELHVPDPSQFPVCYHIRPIPRQMENLKDISSHQDWHKSFRTAYKYVIFPINIFWNQYSRNSLIKQELFCHVILLLSANWAPKIYSPCSEPLLMLGLLLRHVLFRIPYKDFCCSSLTFTLPECFSAINDGNNSAYFTAPRAQPFCNLQHSPKKLYWHHHVTYGTVNNLPKVTASVRAKSWTSCRFDSTAAIFSGFARRDGRQTGIYRAPTLCPTLSSAWQHFF